MNKATKCVTANIGHRRIKMIVVYRKQRNSEMREETEEILEEKDEPLLIVGNFNGHVGSKGEQKLDTSGKMILKWMEKYQITVLNDDERCQGE